jgi:hypothetical protein
MDSTSARELTTLLTHCNLKHLPSILPQIRYGFI